jgi:hypothetical protein
MSQPTLSFRIERLAGNLSVADSPEAIERVQDALLVIVSDVREGEWLRTVVEAFLLAKGEGHKHREGAAIDAMRAVILGGQDSSSNGKAA